MFDRMYKLFSCNKDFFASQSRTCMYDQTTWIKHGKCDGLFNYHQLWKDQGLQTHAKAWLAHKCHQGVWGSWILHDYGN